MRVVGIDMATQPNKTGIAIATAVGDHVVLERVVLPTTRAALVEAIVDAFEDPCLLAIDAPLGWPVALGATLAEHVAGHPLAASTNEMFLRETDALVHRVFGKKPLEVGADRIARTAHAALKLIDDLRQTLAVELPLAWATPTNPCAIEVYPAATLLAHGISPRGYKGRGGGGVRAEIARRLEPLVELPPDPQLIESDHALDAAICVLAAADFLAGRCLEPTHADIAQREGWIWTAPPAPSL